ncbi:MAG: hypothetical protein ACLP8B_23865, partial [Xanthobacteraceae bacterium]
AAISLDLRRALRLGLRVADGFGQHLAQLCLGLRGLSRGGFSPLCHETYMGMPERELNPTGGCDFLFCRSRYDAAYCPFQQGWNVMRTARSASRK